MWLCTRQTSGRKNRTEIPAVVRDALVRWYSGEGDENDHRASVTLVVAARDTKKWFACDCLGNDASPPLMSPAYLSIPETYYLRRLTSARAERPEHLDDCPFFRPQTPHRLREAGVADLRETGHPEVLFNAHRLAPEKLAQVPDATEPGDRSRGAVIPRLARLLWWLLERAHLDEIGVLPATGSFNPSISDQFDALRKGARNLEIAPGIALTEHLYLHPKALSSNRIYAHLRNTASSWPNGFAPQAFLIAYALDIRGNTITTPEETIKVHGRIQYAAMNRASVGGPYLTITVIGEHSKAEGYVPLRA